MLKHAPQIGPGQLDGHGVVQEGKRVEDMTAINHTLGQIGAQAAGIGHGHIGIGPGAHDIGDQAAQRRLAVVFADDPGGGAAERRADLRGYDLAVMRNPGRHLRVGRQLVAPHLEQLDVVGDHLAVVDLEPDAAKSRAVAVGLRNERAGVRVHDRLVESVVGMRPDVEIDAGHRRAEAEVLVERSLHPGVVLRVGLHRSGQPLVGEHDEHIHCVAQFRDAGLGFRDRVGEFQLRHLRRHDGVAGGVCAHDADDAHAHAVAFKDRVGPGEADAGALVADVAAQDGKRHPLDGVVEDLPAIVELMVARAHRIVAHQGHHLHQRLAVGEVRHRAGEHVAGIQQERGAGGGAFPFHERGQVGGAAEAR